MYNAGERKDVRRAAKEAAQALSRRQDYIRQMMSTSIGREYAHESLVRAHVFSVSFDRDPLQMAFNEGERNQGLMLLNDIMQTCPDQYVLMEQEANARSTAVESRRTADAKRSAAEQQSGRPESGWEPEGSNTADTEYEPGFESEHTA